MWWRRSTSLGILTVGTLLATTTISQADVVRLSTGRLIHGKIIAETSHAVTIENPTGKFTFPRQRIESIQREAPEHNQLREVGSLLESGRLDTAIATYNTSGLSNAFANDTLESLMLEKLDATAEAVTATSATSAFLADRLKLAITPPPELLLLIAVLSAENKQADHAAVLAGKIPTPLPRKPVWPERTLAKLSERLAEAAIKNNNGALVAISAHLSSQFTPGFDAKKPTLLTTYAQIEAHRVAKEYIRATALFRPEHFLHRSDIFIPLAEKVLRGLLQSQPAPQNMAALESARITILPYVTEDLRKQTICHLFGELAKSNQFNRARQIADEISVSDPDLGAFATHLVSFHTQRVQLPPGDPLRHYKLASWARSMGLLDESESLLRTLQNDPRFAPNVNLQLQLIESARCQQTLADLQRLYKEGNYTALSAQSQQFISTNPPEQFAARARDFAQLANFHQWNAQNKASSIAEAEYQQAERLVQRQEYDAALDHLNKIQAQIGDAGAAAKAAELRDKILKTRLKNSTATGQ